MKTPIIITACMMIYHTIALAFDPIGPPPTKTTVWTTKHASSIVIPRVDFDADDSLEDGLEFLQLRHAMPAAYGIEIDGSALGKERLKQAIHYKARDKKLLEILAEIADLLEANLLIDSGAIRLIPKNKPKSMPSANGASSDPDP